jgi:WASH complex subunit strumpellin
MDLLNPENLCGQNLLRIVSRGSSIIAEELRLSDNIPEVFQSNPDKIQDQTQLKYVPVLFDFQYLREPEDCEKKINSSTEMIELDQEFQESHGGTKIKTTRYNLILFPPII